MAKQKQSDAMSSSNFNLPLINTEQLEVHVRYTIDIGGNIAFFGRRGTGKTDIAKQEVRASGFIEEYRNLSVLERTDLGGYPNIMSHDQARKYVEFLMPDFFKNMMEGDKKVVLILDEMDKADSSLLAPLLEILQNKTINGKPLKNLWSVIMTGNLISEGGSRPSPPLLDRTEKYLVKPDAVAWLNWAGRVGNIHPAILAFIKDNQGHLFGEIEPDDRYSDASPRGWTRASNIVWRGEEKGWSTDDINLKVSGCVGVQAGTQYFAYYAYYRDLLPLADKIFKGENIDKEFHKLQTNMKFTLLMILLSRLTIELDKAELPANVPMAERGNYRSPDFMSKTFSNIGKFMPIVCDQSPEIFMMAMRSQVKFDRIVKYNFANDKDWGPIIQRLNASVKGK